MSRYGLTTSRRRTVSDAYGTRISGLSGLVAYWRGDASTVDAVSGGTSGTLTNGATYGTALLAARPSASSFSLDGVDDYVNIQSQAKFALTSALSVECWVNFDTPASSGVREIFVRQNAWGIEQSGSTIRFFIYRGGTSVGLLTSATLTAGTTYHVVGTFDGTATKLYVNGSQVATTTTAGAIDSTTNPVQIGAWGAGFYFDGRTAENALYNRALTATEVSANYTAGTTAPAAPSATAQKVTVGQYIGWDQTAALTTWESTNSISIPLGHEFGDRTQWTFFENGTNFADWETWVNAKPGRRFSYSAPLLTANDDTGLTIPQKYVQLAAGTYDVHFTNLGNAFQARPALRNAIVRLGWEFNGQSWPWSVPPNDQTTLNNYKAGFNRAAAALRAACPTLEIEWAPNCQLDYTNRTFADMYPGDTYIDYIGIGLYDYYWPGGSPTQAQREAWLRDNPNGLQDQVNLAAARGKRLAHTEWALWPADTSVGNGGGGDRPAFIDFLADWYAAKGYVYSIYNNVGPNIEHRLDMYPNAKARYLARFA